MKIHSSLIILVSLLLLSLLSSAEDKELKPIQLIKKKTEVITDASKAPIEVVKLKDGWTLKIRASESGWNYGIDLQEAILKGKGIAIPIGRPAMLSNSKLSISITLNEAIMKSATIELEYWYSGRLSQTPNKRFSIKLSDYIKSS